MRQFATSCACWTLMMAALTGFAHPAQRTRQISIEGLIYDLKHPDVDRRKAAAILLGQERVRRAVPNLVTLTSDPNDPVRLEAVRALVRINDSRSLPSYIRLTQDAKANIQQKAVEGIIKIYVFEGSGFIHDVKKIAEIVNPFDDDYNPLVVEPYVQVGEGAVQALQKLLNSPDSGIRKDAAIASGILRARSALPTLQDRLTTETDNAGKVELIRAIYKIADPAAGLSLLPFIHDTDKKVHDEAIFTLGRLRISQAVPQLHQLYESRVEERKKILRIVPFSGSDDLRKKVFEALAHIGDAASRELFFAALENRENFYRRYAAEGLGRIGNADITTLIAGKYLREKSKDVRLALSFAQFRLGRPEHLVELVNSLKEGDQGFDYLLELEPREVQQLEPFIRKEEGLIQAKLLEIAGLRGDPSFLPLVEELTESKNAEVVSAANLALRRIRGRY